MQNPSCNIFFLSNLLPFVSYAKHMVLYNLLKLDNDKMSALLQSEEMIIKNTIVCIYSYIFPFKLWYPFFSHILLFNLEK